MLHEQVDELVRQVGEESALHVEAMTPAHRLVVHGLRDEVRLRLDRVDERRPEGPQLREIALCLLGRAAVEHLDRGDGISCRESEAEAEPELVGRGLLGLAKDRRELGRAVDRVGQGAVRDRAVEGMKPELEGSHDPEVRACAAEPPEQIRVLLFARPH